MLKESYKQAGRRQYGGRKQMSDNAGEREPHLYREAVELDVVLLSGLLAIPVIAVVQLLGNEEPLDLPLKISVHCFAVAIPLLATYIFMRRTPVSHESTYESVLQFHWMILIGPTAIIVDVVGLVALFWHFDWIVGVLAITSGGIGGVAYLHTHLVR
jgi:hypothetical protein